MTGSFAPSAPPCSWPLCALVITGIHHTTNAVDLQLMQSMGGTPSGADRPPNIAQASAVVGIILISRKENEAGDPVLAAISAYLGVTRAGHVRHQPLSQVPMLCAMVGLPVRFSSAASPG